MRERRQFFCGTHLITAWKILDQLFGFATAALGQQRLAQPQCRRVAAGRIGQRRAERGFGLGPVAGGQQAYSRLQCAVGFRWRDLPDKFAHLRFRLRSDELGDDLLVPKGFDDGNASEAVLGGEVRIVIYVHFGEPERSAPLCGPFLQDRTEHPAWAAPRRPEIHDDRNGARAREDVLAERGFGYFDDIVCPGHVGLRVSCPPLYWQIASLDQPDGWQPAYAWAAGDRFSITLAKIRTSAGSNCLPA